MRRTSDMQDSRRQKRAVGVLGAFCYGDQTTWLFWEISISKMMMSFGLLLALLRDKIPHSEGVDVRV